MQNMMNNNMNMENTAGAVPEIMLRMSGIHKRFGELDVLKGIDLMPVLSKSRAGCWLKTTVKEQPSMLVRLSPGKSSPAPAWYSSSSISFPT